MNLGNIYKNELGKKETDIIFALMEFVKVIVWGFIIYLGYKFIFGLLLPIGKAIAQMKGNLKKMQETQSQNAPPPEEDTTAKTETPPAGGEYIDYEEIK